MFRKSVFLLGFILILAFVLRLYRLDNPIGDWHAFRQADTSAVSKSFVENGYNVFLPTYFDISNIQSGKDNPNGYRMVEFPIYNVFQAGLFQIIGVLTLEQWGRIVTIASSLATITFIFLLLRKYTTVYAAAFAAFFYAVLPFSIYYGRVILPDPSAAMAITGGIYFFDRAISHKKLGVVSFVFAIIFTAFAFLLKPFTLFYTLPMLYLAWSKYGFSLLKQVKLYMFAFFSITPLVLWRLWISQFPEGIPASSWLFNEGGIRFTGAYFYWIFGERMGKLMLGYMGYMLLFLGFIKRQEKHYGLILSFALSSLIYLIVIARGNVQHDYYQILILPTICILLGRGATMLLSLATYSVKNILTNTIVVYSLLVISTLGILVFSWYFIRDYFNINNRSLVIAGQQADQILPQDAKVIAANQGDTSFLYYIGRMGWPAYQASVEELIQKGATHIVIPSPTDEDRNGLGKKYQNVYSTSEVLILKLTN